MLIQGQVGPSSTQSVLPGSTPAVRLGQQGDLVASQLHGRYYETTYRNNVFSLSLNNVATGSTLTAYVGASGGTPALAVYNPPGSGKNLVPLMASYNNVVSAGTSAATVAWALWYGPTVAITQATLSPALNQASLQATGSSSIGYKNVATTSSTALTNAYNIGYYYWASAVGAFQSTPTLADLFGSVVIPPGSMMALGASAAATAATWQCNLIWEEVPV